MLLLCLLLQSLHQLQELGWKHTARKPPSAHPPLRNTIIFFSKSHHRVGGNTASVCVCQIMSWQQAVQLEVAQLPNSNNYMPEQQNPPASVCVFLCVRRVLSDDETRVGCCGGLLPTFQKAQKNPAVFMTGYTHTHIYAHTLTQRS